jgi:hypothetical protein
MMNPKVVRENAAVTVTMSRRRSKRGGLTYIKSRVDEMATPHVVQLFLHINEHWRKVLSIPSDQFDRFSLFPLKWLRFLAYAIYGHEGQLYEDSECENEVDYGLDVEDIGKVYYYSPNGTS